MSKQKKSSYSCITEIEKRFPVNNWFHNDYYIWPILRVRLSLQLGKHFRDSYNSQKETGFNTKSYYKRGRNIIRSWYKYFKKSREGVDFLYNGAPSHRVKYMGKSYNRYFDTLMDQNSDGKSLLFEYEGYEQNEKLYKLDRIIYLKELEKIYRRINQFDVNKKHLKKYLSFIDNYLQKKNVIIENVQERLLSEVKKIDKFANIYRLILTNLEPIKVFSLCYYSPAMMGMNIAAHQLNIPSVDLQHGPQGEYHMAYGSWTNIPEKGYEVLPNEFHTWDEQSAAVINSWAKETNKHSAKVTGNPWVEGWKKGEFKTSNFNWPENVILYTLQPIGELLDSYIIEAIKKTKNKYNWWLRLHPRQVGKKKDLKELLYKYNLLQYVNIDDATKLPLPEILMHTNVHLTKFSGCALEAFNFKVPTIILDERGRDIFESYFSYNLMTQSFDKNSKALVNNMEEFFTTDKE